MTTPHDNNTDTPNNLFYFSSSSTDISYDGLLNNYQSSNRKYSKFKDNDIDQRSSSILREDLEDE